VILLESVGLGLTNLRLHLLRSILTALGIILGVAAVIIMVSIGQGSKAEALATIERLGARNIIARSVKPAETGQQQGGQQRSWVLSFGLTRDDLRVISENFPDAAAIVPVKSVGGEVLRLDKRLVSQAYGVTPDLPRVTRVHVSRGRYITEADMDSRAMVAVIGYEVARQLFPFDDPLGNTVRIDDQTFEVVGVLRPVGLAGGAGAQLIGRDLNFDVHIPLTTASIVFGDTTVRRSSGSFQASEVQISEIILMAPERDRVLTDAGRLRRIIDVRHDEPDVQLIVPYELLEEANKQALTWNLVLGSVAGISLLVGGIGIMNIMLATVTERTREIGIRRALGATRRHIVAQFLVETGVLSALGGLIGVGLGIAASFGVEWIVPILPNTPFVGRFFDANAALPTELTLWSIVLAFGVAAATGLAFGLYPAVKASKQDPIVALRHD